MKFIRRLSLFWLVFLVGFSGFAQSNQLDEELNEAQLLVYDNPSKALEKLEKLDEVLENGNLPQRINYLLLVASSYSSLQNHKEALKHAFEALLLVEDADYSVEKLKILGFIANQYYILQLDEKLNHYLDKSEEIIAKTKIPDSMKYLVGNMYFVRALNFKDKLDCNFAISYFNRAIESYKKVNLRKTNINMPMIYIQKGYCFLNQDNLDSANLNFRQALAISKRNQLNFNQSHALIAIAEVYYKKGEYKSALSSLRQIRNEEANVSIESEMHKSFIGNYEKLEDFSNYKKSSAQYLDTLGELDKIQIQSVRNLLDTQEKESDLEFKKNRNRLILVTISVILAFIILIVILYGYIRKIALILWLSIIFRIFYLFVFIKIG